MKKTIGLLWLVFGIGWGRAEVTAGRQAFPVDGYAARVNDQIITYGDIRESIRPFIRELTQQAPQAELPQLISQAYLDGREALIEEALLRAEARVLGMQLPSHVIDQEVQRIVRERFGNDRGQLMRALTARRMTLDEWREEITGTFKTRILYDREVIQRAAVSEQAVRAEYDRNREAFLMPVRVRYRYILIHRGTTEEEREVKRAQAEQILQRIRGGEEFLAVSREVSEGDPEDLPWRDIPAIRQELRAPLLETPVGEVSELVQAGNAWYILQPVERRAESIRPFSEVRDQIESRLLQEERQRLHRELMDRLSARHFVERY